jgi:hypothetical protein
LEPYARQVFKGSKPSIRVLPVDIKALPIKPVLVKPVRKVARKAAGGRKALAAA